MERDKATQDVINKLKDLYREKLMPVEKTFLFDKLCSPLMSDSEFESKPQVLLIGQYSTGKTTFIRYLLGTDFPGQRIGPEPTTDRFVAVLYGEDEHVVPGNALCVSPELPFRGLEKFGASFLNKFEGSQLPNKVLQNITLVDSPGILAGKKQSDDRGYEYINVCQWFAQRCDLILLLFDAHKLDISDEFREVIEKLKGHEDKIRCVLNKADQIDRQRLMRVYGALMWGMGKVLKTPEVLRVYVGSFWEQPLMYEEMATLFEREENDLMKDLRDLPRNSAVRKINELVKRARLAKVNAHIISHLGKQMPTFTGKQKKQNQLLADLPAQFRSVMKLEVLSAGDFPELDNYRSNLQEHDFSKFPKLTKKHLDGVEEMLTIDIPKLMEQLPKQLFDRTEELPIEEKMAAPVPHSPHDVFRAPAESKSAEETLPQPPKANNPFAKPSPKPNPFAKPAPEPEWPVRESKPTYDEIFNQHNPVDGKLDSDAAREALVATDCDMDQLFAVWELSDHDADGMLDDEEFAVAMYLIEKLQLGEQLPESLPEELVPPKQRS